MTSRIELLLMELPGGIQGFIREDLEVLQRNLKRVGRIAGGMLAFARQGPQESRLLSLNTVVEDTLMLVRRQLERDGTQITMTFDPGLPHVFGDPSALEQVLMNLLINAPRCHAAGRLYQDRDCAHIRAARVDPSRRG
jgi:C4-dicarboxylate-specific signal transduction histidine kinase